MDEINPADARDARLAAAVALVVVEFMANPSQWASLLGAYARLAAESPNPLVGDPGRDLVETITGGGPLDIEPAYLLRGCLQVLREVML